MRNVPSYDPAQELADAAVRYAVQTGFSKSTAQVFGYLLLCDPMEQSAGAIQQALGLSAGSVSQAVNMLMHVGLVERVSLPHDRRHYYVLKPHGFKQAIRQRAHTISMARELADKGLSLQPDNQRLAVMRDVYALFEADIEELLKKMDDIKA